MESVTGKTRLLARLLQRAVDDNVFAGAVLLVSLEGKIVFCQGAGVADIFTLDAVTQQSIFDLASLTKSLATAMAVLKLVDKGRLSLDTTAGALIGELENSDKAPVTLFQLLRHTSGLPAYREYFRKISGKGQKETGREALRHFLCREALTAGPGEKEVYSDLGYMLLAWIVEKISGQRIDAFVDAEIYRPLLIKTLFYVDFSGYSKMPGSIRNRIVSTELCPWRHRVLNGEVHDENAWVAGGVEGHAGLFGDARSVWQLAEEISRGLRNEKTTVLNSEILKEFVRKQPGHTYVAGFDTPSGRDSAAGKYISGSAVGHLGFTGTSFWIDPEKALTAVLLTNRVHPSRENVRIRKFRPAIHDAIMEIFF